MRKLFSLIAAVLFAGSMMAGSYTIVFKSTAGADGTTSLTSTTVADYITDGAEYVSAIAPADKVYNGQDGYGLKFGNSSNPGSVTMTLATPIKPTSIVMNASPWSATEGAGLLQDAEYETKSTGAKGTFADFTYEYDGNTEVSTIIVGTKTKRGYVKSVTVNFEGGSEPTMDYYVAGSMTNWAPMAAYKLAANPAVEGEYMGKFTFAANDEFKVAYSDGTTIESTNYFPNGIDNDYVITEAGDYTVYFRPDGQGGEGWHEGYIYVEEYVEPEVPVYTCAQVQDNEATETGELNEVQVLFVNGGQFYVRDATGMTLIYKSGHGLAVGNFVSGIVGTSTLYNNVTPQFQPSNAVTDWTITEGSDPAYDVKAVAPVTDDVNGVYNFRNVVFAEAVEFTTASKGSAVTATIGEENITIFNNYKKAFSFEANKAYDVLGVVTIYQNNPQVYFVSAAEHSATAISNTAAAVKAVKRIENGQLVIIKNGVRYDALGTILK